MDQEFGATRQEMRSEFHRLLDRLNDHVAERMDVVAGDLRLATAGLLAGDEALSAAVAASESAFDGNTVADEQQIGWVFARHQPVARDLRQLLFGLRAVPQLERCHDLVEHIARGARLDLRCLTDDAREALATLGDGAALMWDELREAFAARDADAHARLATMDQHLDARRDHFVDCVGRECGDVELAIELVLIGRFYERLGDHAVTLASRLAFLVRGGRADVVR